MAKETKRDELFHKISDAVISALTVDNIQMYVLGTKKNGKPRSIYDVVIKSNTKKKKRKKRDKETSYSIYRDVKNSKKKKKKKKNKDKHWRFY